MPASDPIDSQELHIVTSSEPSPALVYAVDNIADGELRQLDFRYIAAERVGWIIFESIVGFLAAVGIVVIWLTTDILWWGVLILAGAALALVALLFWLGRRVPKWEYDNTRYAVTDAGMEIRRGIWWKHIIYVPRSRIQHTDVEQGPVARRFGIGKLILYTAGTQHASVSLEGLPYETALEIRDYLIRGGPADGV